MYNQSHTGTGHQLTWHHPPQRPSWLTRFSPISLTPGSSSLNFTLPFQLYFTQLTSTLPASPGSLLSSQLTMLTVMHLSLRFLLTFSPPDMPLSIHANLPRPSRFRWSPASPIRPSCQSQALSTFTLPNSYSLTVFTKICSTWVHNVLCGSLTYPHM